MKTLSLLMLAAACFYNTTFGQSVGVGTTAPKNKLHVAGGLRIDTLVSGLDSGILRHDKNGVVYSLKFTNNANDVLRGNGTFGPVGAASAGWSLTGNSGTNAAVNFIGTTDGTPLVFKINDVMSWLLSSNTAFGFLSLQYNTGTGNTAIGNRSIFPISTGVFNTSIGERSLFQTPLAVTTLAADIMPFSRM